VMRPRLIAALGTRRDRYLNAEEIQRCSGIAPLIERSCFISGSSVTFNGIVHTGSR
jgi:hypothetical protein